MLNNYKLKGFITNLGKYNEGELIGEWIGFPIDEKEFEEVSKRIGLNSQCEEYFFTDWEQSEKVLHLDEYEQIENLNEKVRQIQELNEYEYTTLLAIVDMDGSLSNLGDINFDSYIFYQGQTLSDVAWEFVHEMNLPEIAERYFDYDQFERDLSFDGYCETEYGVILSC